jgi:imidazolonepropionase-like amidohydrolase
MTTRLRTPFLNRSVTQACGALVILWCLFSPGSLAWASNSGTMAFTNVNVVPMTTEEVLEDYTVLIEGTTIVAVAPSTDVLLPEGATVVSAPGAFLIPGLSDMHAHLNIDPSPDFMRLFLAEGVTTIRNLNALPHHLEWRAEVLAGERVGPSIYTSGPVIVGPPEPSIVWIFRAMVMALPFLFWGFLFAASKLIRRLAGQPSRPGLVRPGVMVLGLLVVGLVLVWTKVIPINVYTSRTFPMAYVPDTEARARAEVRRQAQAGVDVIKVYDYLEPELYMAVLEEASALGVYTVGHLDHGIEAPLAAGLREVAHIDEFMDEHLLGEISPRNFEPVPLDLESIPKTVALTVEHGALVVGNLVTDAMTMEYLEQGPSYFDRPEYVAIRPEVIAQWLQSRMVRWQGQQEWRRSMLQPFLEQMVREMHAAGVPILAGTDTGTEGAVPSHIHRDLELLVGAGLSPYEALSAATRNPMLSFERMGIEDRFGQVAVGFRGDLVLLNRNPLEEIGATRSRLGVMARGRWYEQGDLDGLVAEFLGNRSP